MGVCLRGRLVLLLAFAACSPEPRSDRDAPARIRRTAAEGQVVAVVNGRPIRVEEVHELARARQLSPREALRELEAEELLLGEASRRGYGRDAMTKRTVARAAVQALLAREVERAATTPEARFAHLRAFLTKLERREPLRRNETAIMRAVSVPPEGQ